MDRDELREFLAKVLCDRGGSWNPERVFANDAGPQMLDRAEWYRRQADRYITKYVPAPEGD